MSNFDTLSNHAIATYATHDEAESALKVLQTSGFDMKHLSIVGQNYSTDQHPVGFVNAGDRMWTWGKLGAFWGAIWGMLFGSAMLFVPGLGTVVLAGWIVSALEGALVVGGVAALGAALASIGIPQDSVLKYETAIKAGDFLLAVHGDEAEVKKAKMLLGATSAKQIDSYSKRALVTPL